MSAPSCLGAGHRIEGEARRVRALRRRQHGHARAFAPDLKLFDRGGAEGVARGDDDRLARALQLAGQLADGRGLARAVHAHHQHHLRALGIDRQRAARRVRRISRHLVGQQATSDRPMRQRGGQSGPPSHVRGRERKRRLDTQIGLDKHLLQPLQHRVVEHALGLAPGEGAGQAGQEAGPLLAGPPAPARGLRLGLRPLAPAQPAVRARAFGRAPVNREKRPARGAGGACGFRVARVRRRGTGSGVQRRQGGARGCRRLGSGRFGGGRLGRRVGRDKRRPAPASILDGGL